MKKIHGGTKPEEVLCADTLTNPEAVPGFVAGTESRSLASAHLDPAVFRQVLGHVPTGVTVITTMDDEQPRGFTVGSFFSVSLDPPLVGFCVMVTSSTWPAIERTCHFGASVLAEDQTDVCRRLATKAADKFAGLNWSAGPQTGSPLLDAAVAHLECDLLAAHAAGDHWIVVGRVRHLAVHRSAAGPLLFCHGGYGRFEPQEHRVGRSDRREGRAPRAGNLTT